MSFGSTAYQSYVRIRAESGDHRLPAWSGLSHEKRLAWEAAAQAVAMAVLPASQYCEPVDESESELQEDSLVETVH